MRLNFYRLTTLIVFFLLLINNGVGFAQKKKSTSPNVITEPARKKYTSLLWEITGNGLSRPSYLFGTMHISNKLVFNLSDSFYSAIRNVDVVALEQNPEVWQEEWSLSNNNDDNASFLKGTDYSSIADDRLTIQTFAINNYDAKLKAALASEARLVNGMLYRNNVGMEDFEEETYLDMYIYRLGRKLNKVVTGVEDYKQSNKLVREAYVALYKDKNRKQSSFNGYSDRKRMEDAYRRGDLDVLDSLQMLSIVSEAFQEKFMYRRNVIQANSIDTIIKHRSLFVGVGAAHLPGERGVIELLRKKGYTLRPVYTGRRDSDEKERVEKIRVPVVFTRQYAEDSLFSVEIPGKKLYRYNSYGNLNMVQYADMGNGSYYMVTRVKTNAVLLGQQQSIVLKKVDSLLYENIPGKIVSKRAIVKNGYNGFDITNRTRKGDEQRYNIYILPDEIIIFKVSGINDYITDGKEADQFFASVNIRTTDNSIANNFQPLYGGFKIDFPVKPLYVPDERNNKKRSEWLASDKNGNAWFVYKANLHQYDYVEADSFELGLMKESFSTARVIKKNINSIAGNLNKYPFYDNVYLHEDGSFVKVRFLIQGNNYFVIGSKYRNDEKTADAFIRSFAITPFVYVQATERKDTALGFTVKSPFFYKINTDTNNVSIADLYGSGDDDDESATVSEAMSNFSIKVVENDTTGEHVAVLSFKMPKYMYLKDSADFKKTMNFFSGRDSTYVIRSKTQRLTRDNWLVNNLVYGDTASSRILTLQSYYKNGVYFYLANQGDTISAPSSFVKEFFDTFTPADTFKTFNAFEKKSKLFFSDYYSTDSSVAKKARRYIKGPLFDSSDLPQIKNAIARLSWKDKNYIYLKKKWIDVVGSFDDTASVNYLASLYTAVKDTIDLQNGVLDALLDMKTKASFETFKKLVLNDPPAILSSADDDYSFNYSNRSIKSKRAYLNYKWNQLYDTLSLSAAIIPDLLDLMVLEDYKYDAERLLRYAVDSGYIKAAQYKQYQTKFLLEAKQALKKQIAKEDKAEMSKLNDRNYNNRDDDDASDYVRSATSNALSNYIGLLIPFWDQSQDVQLFFDKLLHLKNKRIKMDAVVAMIKNNRPVNDSVTGAIAADDKLRLAFYKAMSSLNKLQLFPKAYKAQPQMALSILKNASVYMSADSIVYLDRISVQQGKYKGWAYLYKYKKDKGDTEWQIAISGLQPADTTKISVDEDMLTSDEIDTDRIFIRYTDDIVRKEEPLAPQLQKVVKKSLYALKPSSARFLQNSNDSDDEDSYVADAVKARRYE
ncbi:TraB/GumN family protein [Danxiaibacter flavus]|uniref:TraB/GumN family protein n=1 Tax=Danxiaibacter flavus TaxID=3049108 RepID=A0ABV3ZEB8_9BACT|nr:TraB/GumN family protein [Chitinophagaceae bacterium DXS]